MVNELKLLQQLESITGGGSQAIKQDLLKKNRTPLLDFILQVCYNPFITTKLAKMDYSPTKRPDVNPDLEKEFRELVGDLRAAPSANTELRNRADLLVTNSGLSVDLQEYLARILTKNMNISLGAKLINKAFGKELIPDPSLMLAKDDIERIEKWRKIVCEFKYDGVRVIAKMTPSGGVEFFTRNFNEMPNRFLKKITEQLLELAGGKTDIFFDGELTDVARTAVSGKATSILRGTASESIGDSLVFNIFDVEESVTLDIGKGKTKYPQRRANLEAHFAGKEFTHLTLGRTWEIANKDQILEIYKEIVEIERGEGIILKNIDHVYTCKRSEEWIKMKEVKDCDLEIIGVASPNPMSKREENGWIGGFICSTSDRKLKVTVGSGFSESLLEEIKSNGPESYIGKIAKIKYNMTVEDKNGGTSLFLPTLLEIRPDKNEADSFSKIMEKKGKV
jgi:ATP-dependent DNA ligase